MLPIDSLLPQLLESLEQHNTALLQAPPGSGKTTRVPVALLGAGWRCGRKILMLEPRRLAARAAARFMAGQLGESVGQTVGYRTRLDSRISAATQIEVVTEGILTRLIQQDPLLENYAAVLFDEFHERSLHADLGLALVRESQQALREDLRILLMSATLDAAPVVRVLGEVPIIRGEGRAFAVEEIYRPLRNQPLLDALVACIHAALEDQEGSLLVFLPGAAEIHRVADRLQGCLPENVRLAPLYGNLKTAEQESAIAPAPAGQRKIVLATAIAETSLTIEGVRVVIDSGQQRRACFNPNSGLSRLVTGRVSRAAAEQRKGRAGRVEPGVCYRLWSAAEHETLAEHEPAEILAADLAGLVLDLAQWGAREATGMAWMDVPPQAHWNQAKELLQMLGLLTAEGSVTDKGKAARQLGIHPRLANMVLRGRELGLGTVAARIAALLGERDLLGPQAGADLHERLRLLYGESPQRVDRMRLSAVQRAARQLERNGDGIDRLPDAQQAGRLLALAYPDRVGKRRPGQWGHYQLSNGKGARLREGDALGSQEWLVAAELDGKSRQAEIYLAAPVCLADLQQDLPHLVREREESVWDEQRGTVIVRRLRTLGQLVLAETLLGKPGPEQIGQALLQAVRSKGLDSLPWDERCRQWRARVALLGREFPGDWPPVTDEVLLGSLEEWLLPFLHGMQRWADVQKLSLYQALNSQLDYLQQQQLDKLAPASVQVPAGQSVRLDYCAENGPVLAARLQALFGWEQTPVVAGGRVPVLIHLLSPAQRPLAVTADLHSFWRNVYPQVRKDMRGRYPKHPWPEDPLGAVARQGVKRRSGQD